jgi:recombination endonuclease VII
MDDCTDLEKRERMKAYDRAYRKANRAKRNARHRHRYATEPEFRAKLLARRAKNHRKDYLKKKYGMSLEDYDDMMARQHGACALCERKFKKLCVDHCHKTRKLRRLLCARCNTGLGNFDDDPALLRKGADYVEDWRRIHAAQSEPTAESTPKPRKRKESKSHELEHRIVPRRQGQPHDAQGNPAGASVSARRSRRSSTGRQPRAGRARPRAQGGAGRRRGDQGSPRPHRRQNPAGRARRR